MAGIPDPDGHFTQAYSQDRRTASASKGFRRFFFFFLIGGIWISEENIH